MLCICNVVVVVLGFALFLSRMLERREKKCAAARTARCVRFAFDVTCALLMLIQIDPSLLTALALGWSNRQVDDLLGIPMLNRIREQ